MRQRILRSVNSVAVGMAIEHRKTIFLRDDALVWAEVNIHADDRAMDACTGRCWFGTIHAVQK